MGLATFIGGIHPYEGKELSENKPVQVLDADRARSGVIRCHSDIGAPANPLVAKGDQRPGWPDHRRSRRIYFCKRNLLCIRYCQRQSSQDVVANGGNGTFHCG